VVLQYRGKAWIFLTKHLEKPRHCAYQHPPGDRKESVRITVPSCQVPDRRTGATRRIISVFDEMNDAVGLPYGL
jgi:hypothetical protein